MRPIFITGIGTDVGKTLAAAILTEALHADYWKPVQAGHDNGTDSEWMQAMISNPLSRVHREAYRLRIAASPHIAGREEGVKVDLGIIAEHYKKIKGEMIKEKNERPLVIEGAGGILVPLNENEFVPELIQKLDAKVILVSRNYLGSINHSLLTASFCKSQNIEVAGWIFNDQYLGYEDEIVGWTGYPRIFSIPFMKSITKETLSQKVNANRALIKKFLS
ncbi:MAG TPA: dethiobiotin synthase [Puia sp.]|nr:dethiobiotin synthase [Puia sp.]